MPIFARFFETLKKYASAGTSRTDAYKINTYFQSTCVMQDFSSISNKA